MRNHLVVNPKTGIVNKIFCFARAVFLICLFLSGSAAAVGIVKTAKIQAAGVVPFFAVKSIPSNVVLWKAARYCIDETGGTYSFPADTLFASGDTARFFLQKTNGQYTYYKIFAYEGAQADSVEVQVLNPGVVQKYLFTDLSLSQYSIPVWVVLPPRFSASSKFVAAMCGINRDAAGAASYWIPFANAHNAIIAAPEFNAADWTSDAYILGNMFTGSSGSGSLNPKTKWSFNIVQQIHRELYAACGLSDSTYVLWGHSAGGQFVHRSAFFLPDSLVSQYIVGNPGWYTCPDLSVAYPWGAQHNLLNLSAGDLLAFSNRNLVIMRGTADTLRDSELNTDPRSDAQGLNRYARAGYFYLQGVQTNPVLNWKLVAVPNVGHDAGQMAAAAGSYLLANAAGFTQTASAVWQLTSDGTASANGNITAGSIVPPSTNITGFAGASFGSAAPAGLKLGASGPTNWPADGSATTANAAFTGLSNGTTRYVQFTLSPAAGKSLSISSISVTLTESGSATNINAALGYSNDGINFTVFNGNGPAGNALPSNTPQTFSAAPALLQSGGTIRIRLILWRKANSAASSSSVVVGPVVVTGSTTGLNPPTITISPGTPLVFGMTAAGSFSASQSFTVSGANLTDNITVAPADGFEIRTAGNSFSSVPVTLVQSGGAVSSTAIDVRFAPPAVGNYAEAVSCSSFGVYEQDVPVSGSTPVQYYSASNGTLDQLSSWTTDPNGGPGSPPSDFTSSGRYYFIRNNSTPTLAANWTVSGSSSKVILGDGIHACSFTIPSSAAFSAPAVEVLYNAALVLNNSSSAPVLSAMTVQSGGTYQHNFDGGIQLSGTYMSGSTIYVTGIASSNLWLPSSCGNVVWNCPAQTAGGKIYNTEGTFGISGNLTFLSTGSGYCAINTGSTTRTLNVGGNLDIQGGSFRILGASTGSGITTLNVAGNVTVRSTGTLNLSSTSHASPNAATLNLQGNFLHTAGSVTKTSATGGATITFNGTSTQLFGTTGITAAIDFVINNPSAVQLANGNPSNPTVSGNLTISAGTLDLNGNTFSFSGPSLTNNSLLSGSAAGSVLRFCGSGAQTYAGTGNVVSPLYELRLANSSAGVTLAPGINSIAVLRAAFTGPGPLLHSENLTIGDGSSTANISYGAENGTAIAGNFNAAPAFAIGAGKLSLLYLGESAGRTTGVEVPAGRSVDYMLCANANGVTIAGGAISVKDSLGLRSGTLNNSLNQITLSGGAWIIREAGSLSAAPVFGAAANIKYFTSSPLTTGVELPSSISVLNNLTVDTKGGANPVFLGADVAVNGVLSIGNTDLNTGGHVITLGQDALLSEMSGGLVLGSLQTTRAVGADGSTFGGIGVSVNAGPALGDVTVCRLSGAPVTFGSAAGISRSWRISKTGINSFPSRVLRLGWSPREDNGKDLTATQVYVSADSGSAWEPSGGYQNAAADRIDSAVVGSFNWYTVSDSAHPLSPPLFTLTVTALTEGMWDGTATAADTMTAELHAGSNPFGVVMANRALSTADGTLSFSFRGLGDGTPYYLALKHRNALETWSANPVTFTNNCAVYDFTDSQSRAYGNNTILKASKWCLYGGDVNQDGIVDFSDLSAVDNAQYNFVSGYVATDITGDGFVDYSDMAIADNNSFHFVSVQKPMLQARARAKMTPRRSEIRK